jgi:carbon storage regulator
MARRAGPCYNAGSPFARHAEDRRLAMLVLSRKKNESIVINDDISVTLIEVRGDKVRLGIVAPPNVPVHRQEVYDAIHGLVLTGPVPSAPAPAETDDLLPDLVVECRLTEGPRGKAEFTSEGGFFFPRRKA